MTVLQLNFVVQDAPSGATTALDEEVKFVREGIKYARMGIDESLFDRCWPLPWRFLCRLQAKHARVRTVCSEVQLANLREFDAKDPYRFAAALPIHTLCPTKEMTRS